MNGLTIDWASGEADIDAIQAIDRVSFTHPWTREMYEQERRQPDRSFLAVCRTDESGVAGYISFWLIVDEVHINNVAVRPESRGTGVGRRLVEFALEHGARRGAAVALLEVRRSNLTARRLYERLGFRQLGVRTGYYADPVDDALVLTKDIRNLEEHPAT